jgi:hypothetical protein
MSGERMKKTLFLAAATILLVVTACQKKDDGSSTPGGYAVTPQPCNNPYNAGNTQYCVNGQPAYNYPYQNQPWYTGSSAYNSWYWPYQWNYSGPNCGCPTGYQATYNPYYGVACAPASTYGGGFYSTFNLGFNSGYSQNNQWVNNPQANYQVITGCNTQSQTAVGCDVRINNCSGGLLCVPIGGGSTVGTCQPR